MVARVRAKSPGSVGSPCSDNGQEESRKRLRIRATISASNEGRTQIRRAQMAALGALAPRCSQVQKTTAIRLGEVEGCPPVAFFLRRELMVARIPERFLNSQGPMSEPLVRKLSGSYARTPATVS